MIKKISIIKNGKEIASAKSSDFPDSQFDSIEDLKDFNIRANSWGPDDAWDTAYPGEPPMPGYTDQREVPVTFGSQEMVTEYFYPREYSFQETDITEQMKDERGRARAKKNRDVCGDVIDKISYFNERFATDEAVMTIYGSLPYLGAVAALTTGGVPQARGMLANIAPALGYPPEFTNEILAILDQRIAEIAEEKSSE